MRKKIKFIYFGSSQFSKLILSGLCTRGYLPDLVVSKPDKPKGRGLKTIATDVSIFAKEHKLALIRPKSLKDATVKMSLANLNSDFFIIADYGEIVPAFLLTIPKIFPLCVHPSLLPLYRGSTPIEHTLMNGDRESGITIFKVNERIDAGDIFLQKTVSVNVKDNYFSLREILAKEGVELLVKALGEITSSDYSLIPQDESKATLTTKLKKEDGQISWTRSASEIANLIKATLEWPSAYTYYKKMMVKILKAEVISENNSAKVGCICEIKKDGIYIATSKGLLKITKLKPQGRKEMDAWSFACGYRAKVGGSFSSGKA